MVPLGFGRAVVHMLMYTKVGCRIGMEQVDDGFDGFQSV